MIFKNGQKMPTSPRKGKVMAKKTTVPAVASKKPAAKPVAAAKRAEKRAETKHLAEEVLAENERRLKVALVDLAEANARVAALPPLPPLPPPAKSSLGWPIAVGVLVLVLALFGGVVYSTTTKPTQMASVVSTAPPALVAQAPKPTPPAMAPVVAPAAPVAVLAPAPNVEPIFAAPHDAAWMQWAGWRAVTVVVDGRTGKSWYCDPPREKRQDGSCQ